MLQHWENGLIGNTAGQGSRLAERETLAQVMVRAFRPIMADRRERGRARAA